MFTFTFFRKSILAYYKTQFDLTFISLLGNVKPYLRVHTNAEERCKSKQPHFFEVAPLPNQVKVGKKLPTGCCLISLIPFTSEASSSSGSGIPSDSDSSSLLQSRVLCLLHVLAHNRCVKSDFRWHTLILLPIDSSSVLYWSHYGSELGGYASFHQMRK